MVDSYRQASYILDIRQEIATTTTFSRGGDSEMKLAKILINEGEELLLSLQTTGNPGTLSRILTFTRSVRSDAYYAYLDGRTARAKLLNRFADKIGNAALKIKLREATRL
jgi:hypothetical protein